MTETHEFYQLSAEGVRRAISALGSAQTPEWLRPCLDKPKSFFDSVGESLHMQATGRSLLFSAFGIHLLLADKGAEAALKSCNAKKLYRKIVFSSTPKKDEEISRELRGSATMKIKDDDRFETGSGNVIVCSPHGAHIFPSAPADSWRLKMLPQDAKKTIYCTLLALAYTIKAQELLLRAIEAHERGDAEAMIGARNAIHAFDLKYFFANPVKMEVAETHALWQLAARYSNVHGAHREIKEQVTGLADIIESQRRDEEAKRREAEAERHRAAERREQQQRERDEERRRQFDRKLNIAGIIFALLSVFSILNDIRQLFGI